MLKNLSKNVSKLLFAGLFALFLPACFGSGGGGLVPPGGGAANPGNPIGPPGGDLNGDPNSPPGPQNIGTPFSYGSAATAGTLNPHSDESTVDATTFRVAITQVKVECTQSSSLMKLKIDGVVGYKPKNEEKWEGRFLRVVDRAETYGQQYIDVETHDPAPDEVDDAENAFSNISQQNQIQITQKGPTIPGWSSDPYSYTKSLLFHPKVVKTFSFEIMTDPHYFNYVYFYIMPSQYVSAHPGQELTCGADNCPLPGNAVEVGISGNAGLFDFHNPPTAGVPSCNPVN